MVTSTHAQQRSISRSKSCCVKQEAESLIFVPVMNNAFTFFLLTVFLAPACCEGLEQHVAFDAASASSTYSAGNLEGSPAFNAQQALSGGSGYW